MRGMIAPRTFGLSLSGQSRCRPAAALRIVACQRTPVAGRFIPGEATAGIRSTPLFCLGMVSWTGMVACEEKACHRDLAPVMTAGRLGRCPASLARKRTFSSRGSRLVQTKVSLACRTRKTGHLLGWAARRPLRVDSAPRPQKALQSAAQNCAEDVALVWFRLSANDWPSKPDLAAARIAAAATTPARVPSSHFEREII
jgi:hypothetical protein